MNERLLALLAARANDRGLVLASEEDLCRELEVGGSELRTACETLSRAGAIEILAPLPFLVLRLRSWPGKHAERPDSAPSAYSAIQLFDTQHVNSSYRPARAHGPIDGALLQEILETLGETNGQSFEKAVELYSPHVIRTALDRVRRAKGIRKNRTALFRHLLPRLARDEHRFEKLS